MSEITENIVLKEELVMIMAYEGGGTHIHRLTFENGSVLFRIKSRCCFDASELDMTEEEYKKFINKIDYYETFEDFWERFTQSGSFIHLYYSKIHSDYRELIEKSVPKHRIED